MERIGCTSRNIPSGKAPKSLKTVKWSTPIHFVISRSCVRVTPPAPKSIENFGFRCFFVVKNAENGVGQNVGQLPDPHRDPHRLAVSGFAAYCQLMPHGYNEMCGKSRRAPERKLFPFRCSACLWDLSDLCHETAHFLRGLLLHLPCSVSVGAEGESRVVVTEH